MTRRRFIPISLLIFLVWGSGNIMSWAGIYRCVDDSGQSVFSDTLAQLDHCTPISGESPTPALLPRSTDAGSEYKPSLPGSPGAAEGGVPSFEMEPKLEDSNQFGQGQAVPGTVPMAPSGQAPAALPPCPPGINPLNPLATMHCQPAGRTGDGTSQQTEEEQLKQFEQELKKKLGVEEDSGAMFP
ncbi:MAG: DUF4124 domain-containing protein [Nitrospirales bacterium]